MVRDSYLNLNGRWQYAITATEEPPEAFDGTIVVPFSPETLLSGVGRLVTPDDVLHYRRTLVLPPGFLPAPDARVLLHFGAVDQWCRVSVNATVVGEHLGGYLPFTCDVTDALRATASNELRVVVRDPSDTGHLSRGQAAPGPRRHLVHAAVGHLADGVDGGRSGPMDPAAGDRARPRAGAGELEVTVAACSSTSHRRVAADRRRAGRACRTRSQWRRLPSVVAHRGSRWPARRAYAGEPLVVALPGAAPVDTRGPVPARPRGDAPATDVVRSYAGLRSFGRRAGRARGIPRLLLNGEPYFHAGVLDQGYWSDGGYTAPSDEAMVHDIATMKEPRLHDAAQAHQGRAAALVPPLRPARACWCGRTWSTAAAGTNPR